MSLQPYKLPRGAKNLRVHSNEYNERVIAYVQEVPIQPLQPPTQVYGYKSIIASKSAQVKLLGIIETHENGTHSIDCPQQHLEVVYARYLECKKDTVLAPVLAFIEIIEA